MSDTALAHPADQTRPAILLGLATAALTAFVLFAAGAGGARPSLFAFAAAMSAGALQLAAWPMIQTAKGGKAGGVLPVVIDGLIGRAPWMGYAAAAGAGLISIGVTAATGQIAPVVLWALAAGGVAALATNAADRISPASADTARLLAGLAAVLALGLAGAIAAAFAGVAIWPSLSWAILGAAGVIAIVMLVHAVAPADVEALRARRYPVLAAGGGALLALGAGAAAAGLYPAAPVVLSALGLTTAAAPVFNAGGADDDKRSGDDGAADDDTPQERATRGALVFVGVWVTALGLTGWFAGAPA